MNIEERLERQRAKKKILIKCNFDFMAKEMERLILDVHNVLPKKRKN